MPSKEGVEVIGLSAQEPFPEQVFTRDIGYTLGDTVIVTKMGSEIRSGEEQVLADWLQQQGIPFHQVPDHSIEGGDVLIDGQAILLHSATVQVKKAWSISKSCFQRMRLFRFLLIGLIFILIVC